MESIHVNEVAGLLKRGCKDIQKAVELMETRVLVGDINRPKPTERKRRSPRQKKSASAEGSVE